MEAKIKGGYYMKARCIQNSKISYAPPYIREIWDWLLKEANHSESKENGILRGQTIRTYQEIQKGLSWQIGYRKEHYSKSQCENAMKYLRREGMITTTRTTRGIIINISKYAYYQDYKNYESHNEKHNESHNATTMLPADKQEEEKEIIINKIEKENIKEKEILSLWNSKKIIVHEETEELLSDIGKTIKQITMEELIKDINAYGIVFNGKEYFLNYKWTLKDFLSKQRGKKSWQGYTIDDIKKNFLVDKNKPQTERGEWRI